MVHILGLDVASEAKAVVFVGPYEHHKPPGRGASRAPTMVAVEENARRGLSRPLRRLLRSTRTVRSDRLLLRGVQHHGHPDRRRRGDGSAPPARRSELLGLRDGGALRAHRHEPRRGGPHAHLYKDAVFVSAHKFVGGPRARRLIAKKRLFRNASPTRPAAEPSSTSRTRSTGACRTASSERRAARRTSSAACGGPRGASSSRTSAGEDRAPGEELTAKVLKRLRASPEIVVRCRARRGASARRDFLVRYRPGAAPASASTSTARRPTARRPPATRFLHHNFVSALLNDLYDPGPRRARAGLRAAPHGHRAEHARIEAALLDRRDLLRPSSRGSRSRTSCPTPRWSTSSRRSRRSHRAAGGSAPMYRFNHKTGQWQHRTRFTKFPGRRWLSSLRVDAMTGRPRRASATGGARGGRAAPRGGRPGRAAAVPLAGVGRLRRRGGLAAAAPAADERRRSLRRRAAAGSPSRPRPATSARGRGG